VLSLPDSCLRGGPCAHGRDYPVHGAVALPDDRRERNPDTAAALARLYEVDLIEDPGDVDLYLALAARTGGPVLEIAAGSGRLALPLAEAGYQVTLVDIDPAMLVRRRSRRPMRDPRSAPGCNSSKRTWSV